MRALTLFNQNFAMAERSLQLYQLAAGLKRSQLPDHLKLPLCSFWGEPENACLQHASNDKVIIFTRPTASIPSPLTEEGGFDFLLRQAVIQACTSLETFFWDMVRENALTIVRIRRKEADEVLRNLTLTLEEYISIEQYDDSDLRLGQIILKNFERKTLYSTDSIDRIARMLTVNDFWQRIEKTCGEPSANIKRLVGDLIARRNQIVHRADRPDERDKQDGHGFRRITFSWTNMRIQAVKTLVAAAAEIFTNVVAYLEQDLQSALQKRRAKVDAVGTG